MGATERRNAYLACKPCEGIQSVLLNFELEQSLLLYSWFACKCSLKLRTKIVNCLQMFFEITQQNSQWTRLKLNNGFKSAISCLILIKVGIKAPIRPGLLIGGFPCFGR